MARKKSPAKGAEPESPETLTIRMTNGQAALISDALELYVRLGLGQMGYLGEWFTLARMVPDKHLQDHKNLESVRKSLTLVKHLLFEFEHEGQSYGIGSPELNPNTSRAYEIKKVLDRELSFRRNPNPDGFRGVSYDGVVVKYSDYPLIEVLDAVEKKD